jgi:hypothetical protein
MKLRRNENSKIIPGFAPKELASVTLAVEWVPGAQDVKFRVPSACTYKLDGSAVSASLQAGTETVILPGVAFTFDTTMVIEVM